MQLEEMFMATGLTWYNLIIGGQQCAEHSFHMHFIITL